MDKENQNLISWEQACPYKDIYSAGKVIHATLLIIVIANNNQAQITFCSGDIHNVNHKYILFLLIAYFF